MQQTKPTREVQTVKCPYMPQHIMPRESLLNHLSRCSATNKHLFTKCKYNPIHVYPNAQIQEHYRKCKDKAKFAKHQESSDDWGVSDQDVKPQPKQQQKTIKPLVINQSVITPKSDPDSDQEWVQMQSDSDNQNEQIKTQLQNMSIASNQSKKSKNPQSSIQSFTESEAPQWQNSSKRSIKRQDKHSQNHSRSIQNKKQFLNESDRFVYEESEPEEKTNKTKKNNKTMNSISESEKSRDHGSKKTQQFKKPKVEDEDEEIEVEDM